MVKDCAYVVKGFDNREVGVDCLFKGEHSEVDWCSFEGSFIVLETNISVVIVVLT